MQESQFCEVYSLFINNLAYLMSNAKEGSFPHGEEEVVVPDFKLLMKSLEQKFDRIDQMFWEVRDRMDKIEGKSSANLKRPVGRVMKEQFEHDFGEDGDDYYDDGDNASKNFKSGFRGGCGNRNGRGVRDNENVYDRYNRGWITKIE